MTETFAFSRTSHDLDAPPQYWGGMDVHTAVILPNSWVCEGMRAAWPFLAKEVQPQTAAPTWTGKLVAGIVGNDA